MNSCSKLKNYQWFEVGECKLCFDYENFVKHGKSFKVDRWQLDKASKQIGRVSQLSSQKIRSRSPKKQISGGFVICGCEVSKVVSGEVEKSHCR